MTEARTMPYPPSLISNDTLSHGTVECTDMVATRRFYADFLGLGVHRVVREAQYLHRGGPWTVVCVCVDGDEGKEQPPENHFKLSVESPEAVDAAHARALAEADRYGIRHVGDVREEDGHRAFLLQDLNRSWWEITDIDQSHYDAIFARGDAVPA